MEGVEDFPYQAEYAKSSRASCRGCKGNIEKGLLRLAVLVQSPAFDGKITQWYHERCFFVKQRPKNVSDIAHFDSLRWEDQQKIKDKIEKGGLTTPSGSKKGKGGKKGDKDFSIEYAKSGRAVCKKCDEKILKDVIRISKLNYESETARRFGPVPMWHHVDCFAEARNELEYFDSIENMSGFNTLSADDKKMLRGKIKKLENKRKAEDEPDTASKKVKSEDEQKMKKQNDKLFYFRDLLQKNLTKSDMVSLLEYNDYFIPTGESRILDLLIDLMTFGVPEVCTVCNNGNFLYKFGIGYKCYGNVTEWTRCTNVTDNPKRRPFKVPKELQEEHTFLGKYKFKDYGPRHIIKREIKPSVSTNGVSSKSKPLENMSFVFVGSKFSKSKKEMKEKIISLGGEVSTKVERSTAAIITSAEKIGKMDKKIGAAKVLKIQCVPEDFLDEVDNGGAVLLITKKNLVPWGNNPEERISLKSMSKTAKSSSKSGFTKKLPDKMKMKLKGGAVVDPDSGLQDCGHVYQKNGKIYNSVLGYVNFEKGTNSYYKLQIIEQDDQRRWYVFRSWGRIGTTIGGTKLEDCEDINDALRSFNSLYEEKSGQKFTEPPQKLPGYWYPLEIDYGQDQDEKLQIKTEGTKSKLPTPVQKLISLIFDINRMKSAMMEFEIDLKKMPLGKLSKRQLESAYNILSTALQWVEKKEDKSATEEQLNGCKVQLLDCSNRFYTLIPHDFGMNMPPLLDNETIIKSKIEMIDNLREIEIAYNLLKSEDVEEELDPLDQHYKKLKTDIEPIKKETDEFKMIEDYIKNTHASTHSHYSMKINEVFKVNRDGEKKRFKPFKKLHNRQLLWHGSRLTNYVGILSQGLRIAPPEAPVTGYMFGKGVYFADMVSKSANYCATNSRNNTGLLLLCEVALGDMHELKNASNITKLPKGKHSTKGLGATCPDPSQDKFIEDNVKVPLGKGINSGVKNTSLLYNEYIVYDTAQINIKYLIETSFKYNYGF